MTVSNIFSEPLIFLPPEVVWWFIITSHGVLWKDRLAEFKFTAKEVLNLYYDRYLEHSNPIFQQSNDADNDVPANVFICEKGPLLTSRSGTNGPSLCFVWSLTVIVTWKIANQSLQQPLQFMMMHHCATFGLKHFNSSENVIRTNVNWHF